MTPEQRAVAVDRMTLERDRLRRLLGELDELRQVTPERCHRSIERAQGDARRLFGYLGAVRDDLGRLARDDR